MNYGLMTLIFICLWMRAKGSFSLRFVLTFEINESNSVDS